MSNDKLDEEINGTKSAIAEKESELVGLKGKLQGLLIARKLVPSNNTQSAKGVNEPKPATPNFKIKTGNPPVGKMVMQVMKEAKTRIPYQEVCRRVRALAPKEVSEKTISSTLSTLKKDKKLDHNLDGYIDAEAL